MSDRDQEVINRLRRAYEAFNRAEFDTAIELAHPEIEFVTPGGQSSRQGAGALRAWMEPDAFDEQRIEPREFRLNGDRVLVRQHTWSRGAGSGIELDIDNWTVWTFDDDGRATRIEAFLPHQEMEALEAAGLRE